MESVADFSRTCSERPEGAGPRGLCMEIKGLGVGRMTPKTLLDILLNMILLNPIRFRVWGLGFRV